MPLLSKQNCYHKMTVRLLHCAVVTHTVSRRHSVICTLQLTLN